jgi:hypothetical protein
VSQPGPSHQSSPDVPKSAIDQIVSAGFSPEDAITELRKADGNVQHAIDALLAKSAK